MTSTTQPPDSERDLSPVRRRVCVLSERISRDRDDGIKNIALALIQQFRSDSEVLGLSEWEAIPELNVRHFKSNRWYLSANLRNEVASFRPDVIIYIPWASATLRALIRARILQIYSQRAASVIISVQPTGDRLLKQLFGRFLRPNLLITQSEEARAQAEEVGLPAVLLPVGVDSDKFAPAGDQPRLRAQLALPREKFIVLHVGHLERNRLDPEPLGDLNEDPNVQLVVVGSPHTPQDSQLLSELRGRGIIVITDYVAQIQHYYQAADLYLFPVFSSNASAGIPLSVLEAMACNLPVLTTRFQGLPSIFKEGNGLFFFDRTVDIVPKVRFLGQSDQSVDTRRLVSHLTWGAMADRILELIADA